MINNLVPVVVVGVDVMVDLVLAVVVGLDVVVDLVPVGEVGLAVVEVDLGAEVQSPYLMTLTCGPGGVVGGASVLKEENQSATLLRS